MFQSKNIVVKKKRFPLYTLVERDSETEKIE